MHSNVPPNDYKNNKFCSALGSYLARGWVPNPTEGKKPVAPAWPKLTIKDTQERLADLWPVGTRRGVGLLLGAPSAGLVDVDKDCAEARCVAVFLLPATPMVWGRQSAPDSHSGYVADNPPNKASTKYADPVTRAALVELRSTGGQTVVPPTLLPVKSGDGVEPVVWRGGAMGEPARVNIDELQRAVAAVGAVALLARYWPGEGARHEAALALCGALARAGFDADPAERIVRAVCSATRDTEVDDRVRCVASTLAAQRAGENLTGWPSLAALLGESGAVVTRAARTWLGCPDDVAGSNEPDPAQPAHANSCAKVSTVVHGIELTATCDGPKRYLVVGRHAGVDRHRHTMSLDSAPAREKFVKALAACVWPDADQQPPGALADLGAALLNFAANPPSRPDAADEDGAAPVVDDPRLAALEQVPDEVRAAAEELLRDPCLVDRVAADIEAMGVTGERDLGLTLYLIGTSAQLTKPLSGIVTGSTSSGKSYAVSRVAALFPPEVTLFATSCTANALYYAQPGTLRHRWIVAGERSRRQDDDAADATKQFREMIETGRLVKLVTQKDADGNLATRTFVQDGPIALAESTTVGNVFEEDANRCLMLTTNETRGQTRAILRATGALVKGIAPGDESRVVAVHNAAQRMIPRCEVVAPYATRLADAYPDDRVDVRRSFRHLLQLTKAVALLHFMQRDRDDKDRVIATVGDYEVAARLAARPLAFGRGALSDGAMAYWQLLAAFKASTPPTPGSPATTRGPGTPATPGARGEVFTSTQAYALHSKRATVKRYLDVFDEMGLIEQVTPPKGRIPAEWVRTGSEPSAVPALPSLDDSDEALIVPPAVPPGH